MNWEKVKQFKSALERPYMVLYKSNKSCDCCGKAGHRLYSFSNSPGNVTGEVMCTDCIVAIQKGSLSSDVVANNRTGVVNAQKVHPAVLSMTNVPYKFNSEVERLFIACLQFGSPKVKAYFQDVLVRGDFSAVLMGLSSGTLQKIIHSSDSKLVKFLPKDKIDMVSSTSVTIGKSVYTDSQVYEIATDLAFRLLLVKHAYEHGTPSELPVLCPSCGSRLRQTTFLRQNDEGESYAVFMCKKNGCKSNKTQVPYRVFSFNKILVAGGVTTVKS